MLIKYNNSLLSTHKDLWTEILFCKNNKFIVVMYKKYGLNMYFYYNSKCHLISFDKCKNDYDYKGCLLIYDLNHPPFIYDDDNQVQIDKNIKNKYLNFYNYLINSHSVLDTVLDMHFS